jgi:hypothetical protein
VAEVLVEFSELVVKNDRAFRARACGSESDWGLWEGWIEFVPLDGGPVLVSGRETTQPNRQDTVYWATGLSPVYLEGALVRAFDSADAAEPPAIRASGRPVPTTHAEGPVLNPFAAYRKGEALLRRQLGALSAWRLVDIITAHGLSSQDPASLAANPPEMLVELIVAQVAGELKENAPVSRDSNEL